MYSPLDFDVLLPYISSDMQTMTVSKGRDQECTARWQVSQSPRQCICVQIETEKVLGGVRSRRLQSHRSLRVGNPKEANGSAVQVRRPSRSAHVSRTRHTAVGAASRMRPATACAGSADHAGGAPSVATWGGSRDVGGSLSVVEVCVLAYVVCCMLSCVCMIHARLTCPRL